MLEKFNNRDYILNKINDIDNKIKDKENTKFSIVTLNKTMNQNLNFHNLEKIMNLNLGKLVIKDFLIFMEENYYNLLVLKLNIEQLNYLYQVNKIKFNFKLQNFRNTISEIKKFR